MPFAKLEDKRAADRVWRRAKRLARRAAVLDTYGTKCVKCGKRLNLNTATVDHVMPRALGGTDELSNLRPMCFGCNREKWHKDPRRIEQAFYDDYQRIEQCEQEREHARSRWEPLGLP